MDVLKLDVPSYLPVGLGGGLQLVEGYNSCIWTERYLDPGDFQIKTNLVAETMSWLPRGSFISLRDTTEVMRVESHEIDEDAGELTVKGSSIDAFAKKRWLVPVTGVSAGKKYRMARDYTAAQAASVLLWNAFVNDTEVDVTHISTTNGRTTRGALPNVDISDSTTVPGFLAPRWVSPGQMYPELMKFLHWNRLGIRGIRPVSPPAKIVKVSTTGTALVTYTSPATVGATSSLLFDIYNGVDRSLGQTARDRVVFRQDAKHLDKPKYTMSSEDYYNMAFVTADGQWNVPTDMNDDAAGPFGWDRNELFLDIGNPDQVDADTYTQMSTAMRDLGKDALADHPDKQLVDGQVRPDNPYVYKRDYNLGDKVSLMGKYGITMTMRVMEYIRTEEKGSGESGYPTLEVAD